MWRNLWIKKTRHSNPLLTGQCLVVGLGLWSCGLRRGRGPSDLKKREEMQLVLGHSAAGLNDLRQLLYFVVSITVFRHFLADFPVSIHHRGVVLAAKSFADFG